MNFSIRLVKALGPLARALTVEFYIPFACNEMGIMVKELPHVRFSAQPHAYKLRALACGGPSLLRLGSEVVLSNRD